MTNIYYIASSPLIGLKFNRLTIIKVYKGLKGNKKGLICQCKCECGNIKFIAKHSVISDRIKSCGCLRKENRGYRIKRDTKSKHPMYYTWKSMHDRCYNINNPSYKHYGMRGIMVCDKWGGENGFVNYLTDIGDRPSKDHSIDRIDVNGNYEPSNCRWATYKEQANNTRRNRYIEFNGEVYNISQWAEKHGITQDALWGRLNSGWDMKKALSTPMLVRNRPKKYNKKI